MKSIEKTGRTTDLAIDAALQELGLERDEVQVDILQIESNGILGVFGKREAKVRVTPLRTIKESDSRPTRESSRPAERSREEAPRSPSQRNNSRENNRSSSRGENNRPSQREQAPPQRRSNSDEARSKPTAPPAARRIDAGEEAEEIQNPAAPLAGEVLSKISEFLGIKVRVEASEDARNINLRVGGEDVGQLIGRRGRTLGSVQYLISRIVNEDRTTRKKINIDVDGYCENREKSVSEMAARALDRVMQSGRPYAFKPMAPQDRRLIHVSLQDHQLVATQSIGDEPSRFVLVYPRSMSQQELDKYLRDASHGASENRGPRSRRPYPGRNRANPRDNNNGPRRRRSDPR